MSNGPRQIAPQFRERVWGRRSLEPFFKQTFDKPVGEVWFECEGAGGCPLLAKLLFTSERLSVQVHPNDDYAAQHHQSLGKTEAWYVIDSQPPGEVAVGFKTRLDGDRLMSASQSGEIEQLLDWRKVEAGDLIFVPAGTVHAIGAGLTICEIQENSDITYRLFDYGRGRELHLEHGARVSNLEPYRFEAKPVPLAEGRDELVACEYFRIERLRSSGAIDVAAGSPFYMLMICIRGSGTIAAQPFAAGTAWFIPEGNDDFSIEGVGEWILTYRSAAHAQVVLTSPTSAH